MGVATNSNFISSDIHCYPETTLVTTTKVNYKGA